MLHKISLVFQKSLVRNSLWGLLGKGVNIVCQAVYFGIVVRVLGAENYGAFVAIASLAALIFPFADLGGADYLIQQVSRDKKIFPAYWGNVLIMVFGASLLLTFATFFLSPVIFPQDINLIAIFTILLADLTGLAIFTVSAKAFVSHDLLKNASLLQIFGVAVKLGAAILLATTITEPTLEKWSYLYLSSALITGIVGILWVNKAIGKPKPKISHIPQATRQGVYFSIAQSANNINSNIDKTMLASMATLQATGIYGAAYKIVEVGSVPILAMLSASYPKFFQEGTKGIAGCLNLAKKLLPFAAGYSTVALFGFLIFAPLITSVFGEEYTNAVATLRWLAPVPLLGAVQYLLADTLTGSGFQRTRSAIQVVTALGNVGLNYWLIPLYSWKGAVWATLGSDSFRVIGMAIAVAWFYSQQKKMTAR